MIEKNTEEASSPIQRPCSVFRKIKCIIKFIFLLILLVGIMGAFIYYCFPYVKQHIASFCQVIHLPNQVKKYHDQQIEQQQAIQNIQQEVKMFQSLRPEWEQKQTVDQPLEENKGSYVKFRSLAEAYYWVKLADNSLQFSQNIALAQQYLQKADQLLTLKPLNNASLLHQALAKDLIALQSIDRVDLNQIYVELLKLNQCLQDLPLYRDASSSLILERNNERDEAANLNQDTLKNEEETGWNQFLEYITVQLRKIFTVYYDPNATIGERYLVNKIVLYQNSNTLLFNAMWGALHRNNVVYQASLDQMQNLISRYGIKEAPLTHRILKAIILLKQNDLQAIPITLLQETMLLFEKSLSQDDLPH